MMDEKISVCIPVYNGAATIKQTVESVLSQSLSDFELVIVDNSSTDSTVNIIKSIDDKRIKLYVNERNLSCGGNLEECRKKATGDIIFYLSADDIADSNALEKVQGVFSASPDVGMILRPYYWFDQDVYTPVRATRQFKQSEVISIDSHYEKIKNVISLSDQISGVAFRKKFMKYSFKNEYFLEMASVVAPMIKEYKAVIVKDNIVAIRIGNSGAMNPIIYKKSPLISWYNLIANTYKGEKFIRLRKYLINHFVASNYIGLVQIKIFAGLRGLLREIYYLIRLKRSNIFNLRFWFFSLGTIIIPGFLLRKMVVLYKNSIKARLLKGIVINSGG